MIQYMILKTLKTDIELLSSLIFSSYVGFHRITVAQEKLKNVFLKSLFIQ